MKTAILVLSDPRSGSEESLGRLFNALAAAYDLRQGDGGVTIIFQGAGTRWPTVLADPDHPAHGLYQEVKGEVAGVSCGCADVFGAADEVADTGLALIKDNAVPNTTGLPSLRKLQDQGYSILVF